VEDNALVAVARRTLPVSDQYDDGRLVTRVDGRRVLTPLFLVLLAISSSDILFALDSIPAIFGISREAFIVFVANAFALLGLRALFFLVTGRLERLIYLSTGLALILAFIGVKLVLHYLHSQNDAVPEISVAVSLLVIGVVLAVTTIASLTKTRRDPSARAHAGSLRQQPPTDARPRRRPAPWWSGRGQRRSLSFAVPLNPLCERASDGG
jgi:tellurite resistance protein TerC